MSSLTPRLLLNIECEPGSFGVIVTYTPVTNDGTPIEEWSGSMRASFSDLAPSLADKLSVFFELTAQLLPTRPIPLPDGREITPGRPLLRRFIIPRNAPDTIHAFTGEGSHLHRAGTLKCDQYSLDGQRLLSDVLVSIETECWKHLSARVGTNIAEPNTMQVFVSYRKRPEIEQFSEAVALRLEQEGVRVRFDKWDMVAGDSLPGKIEEAFAASRACLIILSADYTTGRWATAEMNTAITKRVNENYRVIPVLFEDCTVPELLKDSIRVDFSEHNADHFETRMRDVIGGIFGLTRRPFASRNE